MVIEFGDPWIAGRRRYPDGSVVDLVPLLSGAVRLALQQRDEREVASGRCPR